MIRHVSVKEASNQLVELIQALPPGGEVVLMPVTPLHAAGVAKLPSHLRDPFDRMLVAQDPIEEAGLVSIDPIFDAHGIVRVW